MATNTPNSLADDALELEKVAVGPYCVFDAFKPPLSPRTVRTPLVASPGSSSKKTMENPIMSNDFSFGNGMRPTFYTTAGDDMPLAAPAGDDFARSEWNEWMQWDPATSQPSDSKPLNAQGPVCFLKPDQQQRPPLFNRRQNSQLRETTLGIQSSDIPTSAPLQAQMNTTPFTFGGDVDAPPAFDFDANTLSSPSSGGGPQQHGFYSPQMWDQQQGRAGSLGRFSGGLAKGGRDAHRRARSRRQEAGGTAHPTMVPTRCRSQ